jgi:hypothetical protein
LNIDLRYAGYRPPDGDRLSVAVGITVPLLYPGMPRWIVDLQTDLPLRPTEVEMDYSPAAEVYGALS